MRIISYKEALALANDAADIRGYGTCNSIGYHTIFEDGKNEVLVDIFKHNDNGNDYFAVAESRDEVSCEMHYTESDSVEELTSLILQIAKDNSRYISKWR